MNRIRAHVWQSQPWAAQARLRVTVSPCASATAGRRAASACTKVLTQSARKAFHRNNSGQDPCGGAMGLVLGPFTWAGLSPVILALHYLARRPNRSLKLRPNGRLPGPGRSYLALSASRAWRPTVGPGLALTLGVTETTSPYHECSKSPSALQSGKTSRFCAKCLSCISTT